MQKTVSTLTALTLVLVAAMAYRIFGLENNVRALSKQLDQQTMLISRALGKVMPLVLPEDVEKKVSAIEEILSNEASWPKGLDNALALSERLASVVNKMPPWAQEELLPRLVPRRWDIETLLLLSQTSSSDSTLLYSYLKAIEVQLSRKPDFASVDLEKQLSDKKRDTETALAKAERLAAINSAKRALESHQGAEAALKEISIYEDPEAVSQVKQLMIAIKGEQLNSDTLMLQGEIEAYEKISDVELKELVYVRARNAASELRLRSSITPASDPQAVKRLDEVEKRLSEGHKKLVDTRLAREAERVRQYQVWALNEIKKVRAFKSLSDQELQKVTGTIDRLNPLSAPHKAAIFQAQTQLKGDLIRYMAPINQSMLDEAVGTWFRKKFERAFNEMGDEQIQADLVLAFATADRQPIAKNK